MPYARFRSLLLVLVAVSFTPSLAVAAAAETGVLEKTYTQRSPLSSLKELQTRTKQKTLGPDYDLSKEPFVVCVPAAYDPAKPAGILLLLNYKESSPPSDDVIKFLGERNLIFVTTKSHGQDGWVRCGLALDAVHNIAKDYRIDDRRIYLFDFDVEHLGGQLLAMLYPDVVTASWHLSGAFPWWKPLRAKNGGTYPPKVAPMSVDYAGKAKQHPIILSSEDQTQELDTLTFKAMNSEGFRKTKLTLVTHDQMHYPNYTTDWLGEAIQFFDDNRLDRAGGASTKPATKPTTRPLLRPIGK